MMIDDNSCLLTHFNMDQYQDLISKAVSRLNDIYILDRIFKHDYTVWKPEPKEITNRLGWLEIFDEFTPEKIAEMTSLRDEIWNSGFRHAILLGMGGSSLAPELFSLVFSSQTRENNALSLSILDNTCPQAIHEMTARYNLEQTIFIVSTKSGTTEETLSFFKHFYRLMANSSTKYPGKHFIAITDPGTQLEELAKKLEFRHIFLNNPNLGGRYSALSHFGLAPATLCGVDIPRLLDRVDQMSSLCHQIQIHKNNPAVMLGLSLGELAKTGRDKVTFLASPTLLPFCDWVEQLIAESTGKEGKGILPIIGERPGNIENYGKDRLFVVLELANEEVNAQKITMAGFPIIHIRLNDVYDLGGQFFLWELATAIAGYCLDINPFDQPNVEATKKNVRQLVNTYKTTGVIAQEPPAFSEHGMSVFCDSKCASLNECLLEFIGQSIIGDYFAIQAFLHPTKSAHEKLQQFRFLLREKTGLATSLGFGPRFLHSTGQLHKGDGGNGLFIQITSDFPFDLPIPDSTDSDTSSLSFGALIQAQAMGDLQALKQVNRRVMRFHIHGDPVEALTYIQQTLLSL